MLQFGKHHKRERPSKKSVEIRAEKKGAKKAFDGDMENANF